MQIKKYDEHAKVANEDVKKIIRKKNKKLPIILTGLFLIVFLSALVFEFYHIVNNASPSVSLSKEQTAESSPSNIEKILKYFSEKKLFSWSNKEKEQDKQEEIAEQDKQEEIAEQDKQEEQVEKNTINLSATKNNQVSSNTEDLPVAAEQTVNKETFKTISIDKNKHKYSLQLMAVKEINLSRLKEIAKILVDENYYAYIYKTPNKIKNSSDFEGNYYFRLRIGFFQNKKDAKQIAYKLIKKYPKIFKNYFVALPLREEYQADFFVFSPEKQKFE